eukprot:CAMPEP_0172615970 /NCGR_PEP_ID=MMETSP1068-20121228/62620_1 /TAXON_ID=35684 /ORGANISM="Pseudopedinella elastica, Strain CCMP716" /LENGTH=745 /DNA_ID=CAMNT_0013421271 /DNA_START=167 /DNA_END=2404 /DNA_ORIENTATION=-
MGRGRAGYSRERHVGIVWTKVALLAMGLMMLGVYVAIRPEVLPEAVEPLVVEASGGLSAFEEEMRGGRHLLQSSDKVYITGHDDDKVVYNPETNPTGDLTCKSEGQEDICRGFGADTCKKLDSGSEWVLIFVVLGLLYLFVGIAIICDDIFVPALEVIGEKWELSDDVCGATLMAAGGSAPELATSMVGTFARSDVGFGTIVGSAVFNVLFVIACCVIWTPEEFRPLELTWWPLARDCSYYVFSLVTLCIFMQDKVIEVWEAILQFLVYLGYVILMKNSEKLEAYVKSKMGDSKVSPDDAAAKAGDGSAKGNDSKAPTLNDDPNAGFNRPTTFRAGILQMLTSKNDVMDTAAVSCVARIKGDVNDVFSELDSNNSGAIEPDEFKTMLTKLGSSDSEMSADSLAKAIKEIDPSGNGSIRKEAFIEWYIKSEKRIKNETKMLFEKFDENKSGGIDFHEVGKLLRNLGNTITDPEIEEAVKEMGVDSQSNEVPFERFSEWYENSLFWTKQQHDAEEAAESIKSMWDGVLDGFQELKDPAVPARAKIFFVITLPLQLFFCLVPDCRPPGKEHLCYFSFIGAICEIGVLSILMVELATTFGATLGIPDVIMGLTILAAGTSVPDLLSSVIVAKQGHGDMAVSSSIGSNIFDVAFGLPVPWLFYSIATLANDCNCGVVVGSDGLFVSLVVLLLMVAAIVVAIKAYNWKMTRGLGNSMFIMYFLYVAFAISQTPASDFVVPKCNVPYEFKPI